MTQHLQLNKKGSLIFGSILNALSAIGVVGFSYYLSILINAIQRGNGEDLRNSTFQCIFILALTSLLGLSATYWTGRYTLGIFYEMRSCLLSAALNMDMIHFNDKGAHRYINACLNDIKQVNEQYYERVPDLVYQLSLLVAALLAMVYISWTLLLTYLFIFLIPIILPQLLSRKLEKQQNILSQQNDISAQKINEYFNGQNTIVQFQAGIFFQEAFDLINKLNKKSHFKLYFLTHITEELGNVTGSISQLLCFFIGGLFILNGKIAIGELIASIQLLNYIFSPISKIGGLLSGIRSTKSLRKQLKELTTYPTIFGADIHPDEYPMISLEAVSLSYDSKTIINNVQMDFHSPDKYLLLGESGAGKSSLLDLLDRKIRPTKGNLFLNGQNLKDISQKDLYRIIQKVDQSPYLFDISIRENITLGRPYDEKHFYDITEKCNLTKLIQERGQESIGKFASEISGGERQRIGIARALYSNADIYLFDEPIAALDKDNAEQILNLILGLENKMVIVVSHQVPEAVISRFDHVMRLESASIVMLT